jgi:hypothetical protein
LGVLGDHHLDGRRTHDRGSVGLVLNRRIRGNVRRRRIEVGQRRRRGHSLGLLDFTSGLDRDMRDELHHFIRVH